MEGFKNTTKMKCFKEGGFVTNKTFAAFGKKEKKEEEGKDVKKDTKMIKKGVRQHESALHKGEPKTELKLKTGGRAKKDCGTVKKYKTGGNVENQYAAKKTDKDIKDIANTKRQKPAMLCGGKSVKKMQEGRLTGALAGAGMGAAPAGAMGRAAAGRMPVTAMEPKMDAKTAMIEKLKQRDLEKMKRAMALDPAQQNELIKQSPEAAGLTPPAPAAPPAAAPSAPMAPMKKGGKAKKMNTGGTCS
jgi:hypothetical protein